MNNKKFEAIDERYFKGFIGVLIQQYPSNEMRMVKLSENNQKIFNRNIEADLNQLWDLYDTNKAEYRVI